MSGISLNAISKELMLACRQLGHVISEALACLVASTIVNTTAPCFYVERPMDEETARVVVEKAAEKILSDELPGISCLRLQAAYESAFADRERQTNEQKANAKAAEERLVNWISNFSAKFDQDFDTLTGLYKKIYQFLLLRCTAPTSQAKPPKDSAVEREVAAALESVFPRVGLRSFVALTAPEKAAQLQELAGIVLGIRLFNQHQNKGGAGLDTVDAAVQRLQPQEMLEQVSKQADEVTEICSQHTNFIVAAKKPHKGGPWDKPPTEAEVDRARNDLLYHRQYLCYLINLQEDLAGCIERLTRDMRSLREELTDLDAMVGGRVSVPKEQVYPRFDTVARGYRTAWQEIQALEVRAKLHEILLGLQKTYCPRLPKSAEDMLAKFVEAGETLGPDDDDDGEPVQDLMAIPGPHEGTDGAVRLTMENYPDFLQVPLDFQGFCVHTLVMHNCLLVPGNPALGVVRYAGRYCVFSTERALAEFCSEPDKFFGGIREVCYRMPELIHLLWVHEDFPRSALPTIVQQTAGSQSVMQADVSTETPLHFEESHIDKKYEWNEWKLRREALHMADIRQKSTSTTQTKNSHMRRDNDTQVYLPRDSETNTAVNRGTNPPRWKKYHVGLRGEPQPMKVAEIKFDL